MCGYNIIFGYMRSELPNALHYLVTSEIPNFVRYNVYNTNVDLFCWKETNVVMSFMILHCIASRTSFAEFVYTVNNTIVSVLFGK